MMKITAEFFKTQFLERMLDAGLTDGRQLKPCSEEEILEQEKRLGFDFPQIYRVFLECAGQNSAHFLCGSDISFSFFKHQQRIANMVIDDSNSDYTLPKNALVFASHQGYIFWFFENTTQNDPAVWEFDFQSTKPKKCADTFSDWVFKIIDESKKVILK